MCAHTNSQIAPHTTFSPGRVYRKAPSAAKLLFYDIKSEGAKVQVIADARNSDLEVGPFQQLHNEVKVGGRVQRAWMGQA